DLHAALRFGVEFHHPAPDAFRIKLSVPRTIQRVGEVDALAVAAELHHLRRPVERSPGPPGMRGLAHDAAKVRRSGLSRVERIGDIVLQKLAGAKTGNVEE